MAVVYNSSLVNFSNIFSSENNQTITINYQAPKKLTPWREIPLKKRKEIRAAIFVLFPSVFNLSSKKKWYPIAEYLSENYNTRYASLSDIVRTVPHKSYPLSYSTALKYRSLIKSYLKEPSAGELKHYWQVSPPKDIKFRWLMWVEKVRHNLPKTQLAQAFITELINGKVPEQNH